MGNFDMLPSEIISDIFTRLPATLGLEIKRVCKSWEKVAEHPSFFKLHLDLLNQLNSADSDSLGHEIMGFCCPIDCSLVGSCNGLICLHGLTHSITPHNYGEDSRIVYVCNPITKKYVTLPKLARPSGDEPVYFFVIGFGYVPTENEYKVVRMYKLKEGSKFAQIDVFTLGSDRQWRNEGNIEIEIGMGAWKDGVFANGNIYWNLGEGEIVAFDLADEMFVELPECSGFREIIDDGWNRCIRFGVLGDCLCATHYNTETETSDVWFLEKKQDESLMSWSMGFSLDANTDGYDGRTTITISSRPLGFAHDIGVVARVDFSGSSPVWYGRAWKRDTLGRLISEKPSSSSDISRELEDSSFESPVFGNFSFENLSLSDKSTPSTPVVPTMATLKDYMFPTRTNRASCIKLPATTANFEIKPSILQMIPIFLGKDDENPYFHIRDFEEICGTIRIKDLTDEVLKLKMFPFSLRDKAKTWMNNLPSESIETWQELIVAFYMKFYPKHKTAAIRQKISASVQQEGESLYRFLERFNDLLSQCPHHGFDKMKLVQIIYDGLDYSTKTMVESMCAGEFTSKNVDAAFTFLEVIAEKSQQWESCVEPPKRLLVNRSSTNVVDTSFGTDLKFAALSRRLEALELNQSKHRSLVEPDDRNRASQVSSCGIEPDNSFWEGQGQSQGQSSNSQPPPGFAFKNSSGQTQFQNASEKKISTL
ncbi:hypothetical protein C5167_005246 [Papaver somniferum]|uniref:F-box domain-containing protein n=1 Tax=Papaver somniferum TaxID=3469 RepID=A0A4Y7JDH7_PAPSO|nr:hypothetical protein C5167_005246 [Papaver somniferum]